MESNITLNPKLKSDNKDFEDYIEDLEINFKTPKDYFIGTFNSWNLDLNLNRSNVEVPETIKLELGFNNQFYKMPTFTLIPLIDEETEEYTEVKGYDKSILFDKEFEWITTLPCTAGELAQSICNKIGVELENKLFINSDFMIYRQMVDNKKTYREVIAMISAIAVGNAFINENDKLEIRSFIDTDIEIEEYFSSEKFLKVGPITGVNLAREPIKDYVALNDADLTAKFGSCVIKITNNLIVDDNRQLAITPIFQKLKGMEFYCKKIETYEAYQCKPFSFVKNQNKKILVDTICIKYPSLVDSYISSNQLSKIESDLNIARGLEKRLINAEAKVDQVEGKIELLTSEVTETEEKLSKLEVNVDSISQKVENEIDITREISGNVINLENCMEGDLLELHIYGNNSVFDYLFPSDDLFPSNNLFPYGDSLIKITRTITDNKGEIVEEKSEIIDLGIKNVLRQKANISDEYILKDGKAQIIRRIGKTSNGELYILENEIIEELGEFSIPLTQGGNRIEIINYIANMSAKYVIINTFTRSFATTVELKSAITTLANSINLEVSQKIGKNELIARLNMAILGIEDTDVPEYVEKSIIQMFANILEIDADNFKLTKDGVATIIKGIIGGWTLHEGRLFKNYKENNETYQSGLLAKDDSNFFIYAGAPINGYLNEANLQILKNGLVKAKWLTVNGESGFFYINYDTGRRALDITKEGINWYLNDKNNGHIGGLVVSENFIHLLVNDVYGFVINDTLHGGKAILAVNRINDNLPEVNPNKYGASATFYSNINVEDKDNRNLNYTIRVQGYEVTTTASDKRLKENIIESKDKAIDLINKIKIYSFDWRKDKGLRNGGQHIKFGFIAQKVKKIDKTLVKYDKKYDTYQMEVLNLVALQHKAIQELNEKLERTKQIMNNQQKQIDFLINKLNCKEEIDTFTKGEKNG